MADENKVPSNLEFNQQDLNYIPDPNVFKDMPSDLDYNIMFENFRDTVNSVVYPDNYQPTKSFSSGKTGPNYNPYNENVKFSNNQLDILKEYSNQVNEVKKDDKPLSPILTSKKLTDYERYYNHPKFQELGFNPFRDNETLYNENSTVWDDFSRMGTQFSKLLYTGFVSSYRSLGDLFDDDDYFTGKDLDSAREFSEAMRIGNSTRGGVGGFLNNLGLQSAYTFGIIMNVAVEEALLSFATGGGSLFTAPVRGAVRTGEALKKMTRIDEVRKGLSANVINRLEDVDEAKTFFQAVKSGDSRLMNVLLPETMAARKSLNSASNTVNHLSDIGKQVKTFGGFYRDMRGLNFALSESKMEGGMVYDQVVANGLSERMKQSETGILSDSDFQIIKDNANKASMATTMLNAPFIYLSNQLLLGTAFGGFNKSLAKAIGDNTDAFARRIITKPIRDAEGKIIDATARATSRGFAGTLEKLSAEGFRKLSGAMALRYFANNFGEGIQEVYQEAVAKGTEYYYESIIKDPVSQQKGLLMSSIAEGMGSQMSGQGFHTFMSGFLMGGLVSGPQQVLFRGVPNIAKYVTNREEYNKQNEIFETQLEEYVKNYNNVFKEFSKNPTDFFNTSLVNTTLQKMVSEDNAKAVDINSVFDFLNGKDAAKFVHIHSLLANNSVNIFRKQLNDYLKLSDEDIATAFPMLREEAKKGKAKERITSLLEQVDKVEEDYIKYKDKFQNPFDESKFDVMEQPQEYFNEILKRKAFEHVTFLAMFSSNQIRRTAQRMQSMYSELESVPLFEGMTANDLTVLLSEKRLEEELNLLSSEIELLEDSQDKKGLKEKKQKFEDLQKIFEVSQMKSKKGVYDRRRQKTLTKAIIKYGNNLAKNNNTTVDTLEIDNVIKKIFDYAALEKDNYATRKSVEMLNDPNKFNELFDRTLAALTKVSSKQQYRNNVAKLFATANFRKYLYDKLENNNITLDVEELTKFAESDYSDVNAITKVFINGVESTDPEQVNQIRNELQALSDIYQKVKQDQEEQEETVDGKLAVSPRVEQLLSRLGIELPNKLTLAQEQALEDYINNIKTYFNLFNVDITSETNEKIIEDFATVLSIIAVNNNIPIDKLNDVLSGYLQKTIDENSINLIQSFLELPEVLEIKDVLNEYIKGQGEQVSPESQDQQIAEDELEEEEEQQPNVNEPGTGDSSFDSIAEKDESTDSIRDLLKAYGLEKEFEFLVPLLEKYNLNVQYLRKGKRSPASLKTIINNGVLSLYLKIDKKEFNKLDKREQTEVLAHEIIHALISIKVSERANVSSYKRENFFSGLKTIFNSVRTEVNTKGLQGFSYKEKARIKQILNIVNRDIEELATYGLTDPAFIKLLKSLKGKGVTTQENFWTKLTRLISEFLGISNTKFNELLNYISTELNTDIETKSNEYLDSNINIAISAVLRDGKYKLYYKFDKDEGFVSDNLNLRSYFNIPGSTEFDSLEEANEFIDNLSVNPNAKFIVENNGKQIVITPNMSVYDVKTLKEYKVESNIVDFFNNNNIAVNGNTYTVQSFAENFTTEKPPKSKSNTLSSVDNDVRLIPEKDSNGNTLDARSFQVALMSLDLEDSENVTITLARNEAEPQTRKFQPDKNEDANEFINYKKAPYLLMEIL
jgi:hypothetical protein